MPVETGYRHVVLDEKGVPRIEGTSMKVIELIAERLPYGAMIHISTREWRHLDMLHGSIMKKC